MLRNPGCGEPQGRATCPVTLGYGVHQMGIGKEPVRWTQGPSPGPSRNNLHAMKKPILTILLSLSVMIAMACDQCSCGLLLGVQPHDHASNIGLQWRMRYLQGERAGALPVQIPKHGGHDHGAGGTLERIEEFYAVTELFGQAWLSDRFSLSGSLPVLRNSRMVNGENTARLTGIGDPMLLARYAVLGSTTGLDTAVVRHRLTVGLGVKVPLGRTDVSWQGERLDHDFQPGTGTWDGLLSLEYMVRGRQWGASASVLGRYNGGAADGHRMGNSATITAELFRIIPVKGVKLLPSVGGYVEMARPESNYGVQEEDTGGNVLFSHLGLRLWWANLGLAATWQHALINDLGTAMTPNRERFTAGISYSFGRE